MMTWDTWNSSGPTFLMVLMMVLFMGLIVAGVVLIVRGSAGSNQRQSKGNSETSSPLIVLETRFAKGEIDQQEYEERRRILANPG